MVGTGVPCGRTADGDGVNAPSPKGFGRPERSNTIEKVVEYRFLADLTAELLRRDIDFEVLRGDVDAYGYDIVIETRGVPRHIQLKSSYRGSGTRRQTVSLLLTTKQSGCLVWITYDPVTYALEKFRFLGGPLGTSFVIPPDAPVARSTRPDATGARPLRNNHRVIKPNNMQEATTISEVADLLFGPDQQTGQVSRPASAP